MGGTAGLELAPERVVTRTSSIRPTETLLCVTNYGAEHGYAWDFIEGLYARIADRLAPRGIRTLVAYPELTRAPRSLRGSAAEAIRLDTRLDHVGAVARLAAFIRRERVRTIYFCDRPALHPAFPILRAAGVRRIVVHDHSSGHRAIPGGARRLLKRVLTWCRPLVADVVIAVSEFVARRQREVGLIPAERVVRVWNSAAAPATDGEERAGLGLPPDRPVVMCACRASVDKGVIHLLRAFDRMLQLEPRLEPAPILVHLGDGPEAERLRAERARLAGRDRIVLAGYRPDARRWLAAADLCVAPSLFAEAFCLGVLEPMTLGRPVIASAVGAIPELIVPEVNGILVPPADEEALARAMHRVLHDPALAGRLGRAGRERAERDFTPVTQVDQLTRLVEPGFGSLCAASSA